MTRIQLKALAYARSGDKGDVCNVGVMAKSAAIYDYLVEALTPERIAGQYGDLVRGAVEVYPMANIQSIAIVLRQALGGGATTTLRFDQTGKSMASVLLRMELDVDDALQAEAAQRTREIEGI
jgi:hypothetical protein